MTEIRYRETYENGKLISTEPYEVSDEELEIERCGEVVRSCKEKGKDKWSASDIKDLLDAMIKLLGM